MTDRTLTNLRRRLEKWELDHLRTLCAQQADRIERLETELDIARQSADYWREDAFALTRELMDAGETVGLTRDGQLGIVRSDADDNVLIERRGQPIEARCRDNREAM